MVKQSQTTHHDAQADAERVRAKFQSFYDALSIEEQRALDLGIARALAGEEGIDTSGHGFGSSPIRVLDLWRPANLAPPSAGKRSDQEMDHGIVSRGVTGKHFPEATL